MQHKPEVYWGTLERAWNQELEIFWVPTQLLFARLSHPFFSSASQPLVQVKDGHPHLLGFCFLPFSGQPRLNYKLSPNSGFLGERWLVWFGSAHQSAVVRGQGGTKFSLQGHCKIQVSQLLIYVRNEEWSIKWEWSSSPFPFLIFLLWLKLHLNIGWQLISRGYRMQTSKIRIQKDKIRRANLL